MPKIVSEALYNIVGRQLSSITFVQDYVQLHFDGPCLTAITVPTVRIDDMDYQWNSTGYRDRLCGRIGKQVVDVVAKENLEIRISFDDGTEFAISLRPEDYRAAEAVMFTNAPDTTWVW